ncbi:hypothetical protein RclHR1_14200002 [Rhizophagus clarus]|uniref:VLIG-type G domain-containing protein n=1 Tax=Rhizophagus clarus TaxID=94130 RepID=A0A2Z6QGF9_9GLOM|nr:hypothetical protein RclHR1_14200002 [Rhizophagus clarus]
MHDFEDSLCELITNLPDETVQLIRGRFDPSMQTSQDFKFDLLVLADGYGVNLSDNYFKKEIIFSHYELEIKFNLTENHLQDSEIEILSSFQTRYLMRYQRNNSNFLKINLSKSEFDSIELDSSSNSIKNNNPWFTRIIRDGFRFFEINNDNLVSISKRTDDSLVVAKEFFKSYHNENFICVIGESAFNCKSWQNKSMNLGIAISTATILAEQLAIEQEVSFVMTRSVLDKFSNGMLNFQRRLVHQLQQRSMDNILPKVFRHIIDNHNKQYPDDLLSIDSSDFMSTLNKNPQLFEIDHNFDCKSASVPNELKECVNNVNIEIFFKKLHRIQNMVNYLTIFESCLSSHISASKDVKSNKVDSDELCQSSILRDFDSNKSLDQKFQKMEDDNNISDIVTSSEDSEDDDSSDDETQPVPLSLEEFFQITFGNEEINYDATNFVTDELSKEIFKDNVKSYLSDPTNGILRNIFPYIVDIINRTIPLQRIQDCVRQISDSKKLDDPSGVLKRLVNCKGRDYLVAFLDKVPKKILSKIIFSLTRANIPIPLLFTNKNEFSQKGLRVLREIQSLIVRDKYHLLLSFNLTTSELASPFSKKLYPTICKYREDGLSITSAGSIDISFHSASENYGRKPVAIAEVYFEENPHEIFLSLINSFSQFAFYMFLHVNDQDFEGNSPSSELNQLLNTILARTNDPYVSKISVIYWSKSKNNNDSFSERKTTLEKLLELHFKSKCIKIDQISNDITENKKKDVIENKKKNVMKQLSKLEIKFIHLPLFLKLFDGSTLNIWESEIEESLFASKMKSIDFKSRSDIFRATHLEHEIEALNDKKSTTESQVNSKFMSEGEILNKIEQYRKEQLEISRKKPLSIFIDFAKLINENNIEKIRDFSQRTEVKQRIEDNDISIHDFWREFIILSELKCSNHSSYISYATSNFYREPNTVLKQLYNVNPKSLQEAYKTWILEGEPLQLLDGLSLRSLPTGFLSSVLSNLMKNVERRLIVISVIGLESSGKSTLLNYLFHCGFATSASRCTKGVYMSYRTANFDGNMIDLLILDSEGMASTAQKYITHRTSFDKKITLLALMCSQIVIINTKGLTRDIGDILEVSSWHLDALRHRQSRPRLHFVLRDMVDTIKAQEPAFKDIVDKLKKMFEQIPGCVNTLEDFMTVEQDDVHLLENAFSCYHDDFRPRDTTITENINLPAEVFPIKISKLRKSLLKSALLKMNTSEQFINVQGFIPYMKTVWSKINTYGSFLHFESFKAIQAWYQMRHIVNIIKENELTQFISHARKSVNDHVKKIELDYSKWIEIETDFRIELDLLTNNWKRNCLERYHEYIQEQFDAATKDEGERLISNVIVEEKREQVAQWMSLVREYKDSWLSQCAMEKVGKKINKRLNTDGFENINEAESAQIFEDTWKEIEDDKKEFVRQMVKQPGELKQHVQSTFNDAIKEFISKVRQDSTQREKEKFKRDFCTNLKQPSTLEEHINIDVQQIHNIIEVNQNHYSFFSRNTNKKKVAEEIKDKLTQIIDRITNDMKQKTSLHIEYGQAIRWLEKLCNCLFEFTQSPTSKIEYIKTDFDFSEKYLRLQIYKTLKYNTVKWEKQQKKKLDDLKTNLLSSFQKILSDFSNEGLSKEVLKYILIALKRQILGIEKTVDQSLQNYLKEGWENTYTATNYAYKQSFDALEIDAVRKYLEDPIGYMVKLFNTEFTTNKKILKEIEDYCRSMIKNLTKAVSEFSTSFDPNEKYERLQLSSFLYYLPGRSIPSKAHNALMTSSLRSPNFLHYSPRMSKESNLIIVSSQHVDTEKTMPDPDFSKILKDVNNLLGSVTIEKPVDFCNLLSKSLSEVDIQNIWTNKDRSDSKENMFMYLEAKIIYWNKTGCSKRCPLCSSKCELPDDGHTVHKVTNHLLPAFHGVRNKTTRHPILIICTEYEAHDNIKWGYERDSIYLPLTEFLSKYHPSCFLFLELNLLMNI